MTEAKGKPKRWNHNIHYHRIVLDAVPAGAGAALDVGTGNGLLAAELAEVVPSVTGIDSDATVLEAARHESTDVTWVCGDILEHPFAAASFDLVASVATIHHLPDLDAALRRFAELTAPGGVVVVIGLARTTRPREVLVHLYGLVQHRILSARHGYWEHTAPTVWEFGHSYPEVRDIARRTLPGCTWTVLPLWRYAIVWEKPK